MFARKEIPSPHSAGILRNRWGIYLFIYFIFLFPHKKIENKNIFESANVKRKKGIPLGTLYITPREYGTQGSR